MTTDVTTPASFVEPTQLVPPLARDVSCRAFEALAARVSSIDLTPLLVYDLDTVPASALPSLAEQFQVLGDGGWNLAATEDQQRALLKEAIALHRIRGTTYAVERVLQILGVNASVIEWFTTQPQGAPYTFVISADTMNQPDGAPQLDLNRWGQIARVVSFWKNARSAFTLAATSSGVGLGFQATCIVGGTLQQTIGATLA